MKYLSTRSDDGHRIRLARWNDQGSKDLLLIHGFSEHLGRYEHVGDFFAARGWRVTGVELRGHGESEGTRGYVDKWLRYFEDVQAAMGTIGRPMAIVAHSMGGLVALWSMMHPLTPTVRCVALSNPLLGLVDEPSRRRYIAGQILARAYPKWVVSRESNPQYLSRDPSVVESFRRDPLVCSNVTARLGQQVYKALREVHDYAPRYRHPLRLMVSEQDRVCKASSAKQFAMLYGGQIDLVVYEECFHEIFNEPEKEDILSETVGWIEEHF